MAWWLEDATSRHFGWVRNPSEAFFSHFWSQEKNQKIFFPEKSVFFRKKSGFIGNYRDFSEKSAIFRRNFFKRFFHGFFFSTPADNRKIAEISANFSDFLFPDRDKRSLATGGIVLQYTAVYCDLEGLRQGNVCRDLGHDTVVPARGTRPRHGRGARPRHGRGTRLRHDRPRPRHGQGMPTTRRQCALSARAWAHLGVLDGSTGCAHYALVQFLD